MLNGLTQRDFWSDAGYRPLDKDAAGHLMATDDYLRHLLERPQIAPIASSCAAEYDLHAQLQVSPRMEVSAEALGFIANRDAADNYAV